jgi:hypothetical protein
MGLNLIKLVNSGMSRTIIFGNNKFYSINYWINDFYSIYENKPCYKGPYIYDNCYQVRKNELIKWILNKKSYFLDTFKLIKIVNDWKAFAKAKRFKRIGLKLLKATSIHLGNPRFINFNV